MVSKITGVKEVYPNGIVAYWTSPVCVKVFRDGNMVSRFVDGKPYGKNQEFTFEQLDAFSEGKEVKQYLRFKQ
jgi:hypothetical protein